MSNCLKFNTRLAGYLLGTIGSLNLLTLPAFADLQQPQGSTPTSRPGGITGGRAYERPPGAEVPGGASGNTGRRGAGCSETENGLGLTLLAPQEHVGQTASAYPTFVWFVPTDEELAGGFRVIELDEAGEPEALLDDYRFTTTPGFMSFTLPESSKPLESGESYLLQVYLECDSRRSNDEFVEAFVSVVDAERSPSPLATDLVEQAQQLAEAGLWYDAIGVLSEAGGNSEAEAYRDQLLLELAELEAVAEANDSDSTDAAERRDEPSFSESLQQIAQ